MEFRTLSPADKARAAANAIEFGLDGHTYNQRHFCGTACCIGGHIAVLGGFYGNTYEVARFAANALCLTSEDSDLMFNPLPDMCRSKFRNPTEKDAAAMLRHWADTLEATGRGEIDWAGTALRAKP